MSSPSSNPPPAPLPERPGTSEPSIDFDIGEEYGTARKNLPPVRILIVCVAAVAVAVVIYGLVQKAHPYSTCSIDAIVDVPVTGQDMVMVAINVSVENHASKPAWIHTIQAALDTGANQFSDDAVPAVDAERYFQAFPALKQKARDILKPETRLDPASKVSGTVVVSFPVKEDAFAHRKSLTVTITPYEERPLVLTQ
jgi:hypothetical protein